jgi:RNA polymerase sigma factor (sigma-70 family)
VLYFLRSLAEVVRNDKDRMGAFPIYQTRPAQIEELCRRRLSYHNTEHPPTWNGRGERHLTQIVAIVGRNLSSGRVHALTGLAQTRQPSTPLLARYVDRVIHWYDQTHVLIEQLRAHDPQAWLTTYGEVYLVAYRMLTRRGISSACADAEELAQVACECVLRKPYPYDVAFNAWAAKIVVRCVLQRDRSADVLDRMHRYSLDRVVDAGGRSAPADAYDFLADERGADEYKRVEQREDCLRAMGRMRSATQRSVLEYIYLEGLDAAEVAHRLNLSTGAVHTLHCRGLRSLRRLLH